MQYMDPFTAECEHCGYTDKYDLEELQKYQSHCKKCNLILKQTADQMHKNMKAHDLELWPTHLIFEAFDVWGGDIDSVTDSEFDAVETVFDLLTLVQSKLNMAGYPQISELPMVKDYVVSCNQESLLKMKLTELALAVMDD
ncbi:MAG: hypothetical protein OEZ39_02630 [Gammaproteobacteria bacterium]|nr:hypothetical protein [Gammaproteobacteria bacterium]MDH5650751.1 hypothetical protein [Gammaproteobacteria bacterium]